MKIVVRVVCSKNAKKANMLSVKAKSPSLKASKQNGHRKDQSKIRLIIVNSEKWNF